jgi:hypothetical protein
LPGDALPRAESTLSNLSLFRFILAMWALVLLSLGEPEVLRGRRGRWLCLSEGICDRGLREDVLADVFGAAAVSERLYTAIVGKRGKGCLVGLYSAQRRWGW